MTGQPTRTPYAHKIRYGITGAPILTEDEMDGSHAPGVGVEPAVIELVYRAALDGKPTSVDASVTGWWTRHGRRDQPESQVATHFKNGPDGWPAWLAEEARLHEAHAPAGQAPATDRAAELDQLRTENERMRHELEVMYGGAFDSLKPAPADRAAVLREAADVLDTLPADASSFDEAEHKYKGGAAAEKLRRMADEAQQPETCGPVPDQCDAEAGEPCANHEREQAHAEGEHCFCGPECDKACTCGVAGDCFVPLGHYADCPQAPAVEAQQPRES